MNKIFEKSLDFNSDTFENMKRDMNFVLQRLIGNMQEKETDEGSMTLKIDVTMIKEYIPNYDPEVDGETRRISKPQFKHKVTSAVKINDEKSGTLNNEMELVMDEDTGTFKLVPIANTAQRSIFDSDLQEQNDEECADNDRDGQKVIEGTCRLLPGPSDTEYEDPGQEEGNITIPEFGLETGGSEEEPDDITDELLGSEEPYDDFAYEEPDEQEDII